MKKVFVLILTLIVLLLIGCSAVEGKLEQVMLEKSGILEHKEYLDYQQYQKAGRLDKEGYYIDPDSDEESGNKPEGHDGKIHITFAENRYLIIEYYAESVMGTPIDTTSCYMNPGDILYAKVIECVNPNSNLYQLAEYRIIEYDAEGKIKSEYTQKAQNGELEYKIPSNFTGTEMSIVPVGEYPDRELSMIVYYIDDNGNTCRLESAGHWSINNKEINGNTAKISPIESYVLKLAYDTENYFYVGCEPRCFTRDPAGKGFVEFWEVDATDEDMSYAVELHKFLNLSLEFEEDAKVSINQSDFETIKKNKVWGNQKLQYGDSIVIETSGDCTITDGDYQHISATKDPIVNGYRYTLKVVQNAEGSSADVLKQTVNVKRTFDIKLDTRCNYGICTYKLDGKNVSGNVQVQEGQELTVTCKITDKNYTFADGSQGVGGFIHDIFKSTERTVAIPITENLERKTIYVDDWINIVKKGK